MLSRDGLALSPGLFPRSFVCLPTCFLLSFLIRLLGWMLSRDGLARSALCLHLFPFVSPLVSSRACWPGCCHEMVWLGLPFVSTCFLTRLLAWMLSRDGLARSALCLPTCFLTRLLGWMLSRDGLARSALDAPTCLHLSPHLFPHALALDASPPRCFFTRLLGWTLSRDGLARSALCLLACFVLSPHLFSRSLAGLGAVTRCSGSVS